MLKINGLQIGEPLYRFVVEDALPGTGISEDDFFAIFAELIERFTPENIDLLEKRQELQRAIDAWHADNQGSPIDASAYNEFLTEIGYLLPDPEPFTIETSNIDPEIASIAGPQLVVPIMNARYALNAANARRGSLYDAIYGTDVLGSVPPSGGYDSSRGREVIAWVRDHLDKVLPLAAGSHHGTTAYRIIDGELSITLADGSVTGLVEPSALRGWTGDQAAPEVILLQVNGLGLELHFAADHIVGKDDTASISDVVIESAVTAIMDCEDSVAAVDADDKALAYRNWMGLLKGTLTEEVRKGDGTFIRRLASDRQYTAPDGSDFSLPGRSLMLVRNVGHLMTTPAVLDADGNEVYEGLADALLTTVVALHDLRREGGPQNLRAGSMYVVKPKMHSPDEARFANDVFSFVEEKLGLDQYTVKLGIMDEERRATLNLAACIEAAKHRVAFINTGFLDRTGDEIHTSMNAGPMVRKTEMKAQGWIQAYEDWNVDVGLACGLRGKAQIGKGMWATPDRMAEMLEQKMAHPLAGANCAWVPSPTAATLHATHYHSVDVPSIQADLEGSPRRTRSDLLNIPVQAQPNWTPDEIQSELDNNAQGILGYVVRWIDQGVGCSKVPDINDVGLMEDRATCRISSQHMANWLHHGVVSQEQVASTMRRMAEKVDAQNADDPTYTPMSPSFDGEAFLAASDLVFSGVEQPSGYTEPILHARRLRKKAQG